MTETRYKSILLTGGSGNLGQAIVNSGFFQNLVVPSEHVLDITNPVAIAEHFSGNNFDAVIHCAALARMMICEKDPILAVRTNIIGTGNLVNEVIAYEKKADTSVRFIHISTDGVYPSTRGNYSEQDETIPYNKYGWTKLGAECAVNLLSNFCIIRTRFFNPAAIRFDDSATDIYTSALPIDILVRAIHILLETDFTGTINVGGERDSDYNKFREYKPSLRPCSREDIQKNLPITLASDASMDVSAWEDIEKKLGAGNTIQKRKKP